MIPCAGPTQAHTVGLPSRNRSQGTVPMIDLSLIDVGYFELSIRYSYRVDRHISL